MATREAVRCAFDAPPSYGAKRSDPTMKPAEGREDSMTTPPHAFLSVLVKLGSIAVHADEMLSAGGHAYDRIALQTLLDDDEVRKWIEAMRGLLPVKR